MCCDGTLFARTQLVGEEILRLGHRSTVISASMAQPCAFHLGGRCEIYDQRPQVCRSFRCALLERHESGAVDRDESLGAIETAKAARAAVLEAVAPGMGLHDLRRVATAVDGESQAWRAAHGEVLARLSVLEDCLQTHFGVPVRDETKA
jgi:hypothetical protein